MGTRLRPVAATTRRTIIAVVLLIVGAMIAYTRWDQISRQTEPAFPFGEMRIGIDASAPPFAFVTDEGLRGIDVDLGNAIAQELDVPVRFINMGIDGLYDSILSNNTDVVISSLPIEPWRMGEISYIGPYFNAGLVLVSSGGVHTQHDLPGHSLAYEFASRADSEARRWSRLVAAFDSRPYELAQYALDAVRIGEADAALVDTITAYLYLQQHPSWPAQISRVTDVEYAIAIHRHRPQTFAAVDEAFQHLLQSGQVDTILTHWLGTLP